jgi:hypothetical protein
VSIDVRPSEDAAKYLATDQLVWFGEVTDADAEYLRLGLPADQRFVVDLPDGPDDPHSGIYGVRPMEMALPGGALVPIAGLTWVGVHRRVSVARPRRAGQRPPRRSARHPARAGRRATG